MIIKRKHMKLLSAAIVTLSALSLTACATRASGVAPMSISANEYSGLQCEASKSKRDEASAKVNKLSRKQNNAAVLDAAGVFLLLVPAGSLFGQNVEGELAQAKGEALALQRRVDMACVSSSPAAQ
jgi:hypothetical protein